MSFEQVEDRVDQRHAGNQEQYARTEGGFRRGAEMKPEAGRGDQMKEQIKKMAMWFAWRVLIS